MTKKPKIKTQDIATAGIFLAFILIFMLVPFNTFGVNMAFIPLIAVCLAATIKGFWMGLFMGIAFGVSSLIGSYIHPDLTAILFHDPRVSILPRIFIPITVYGSFRFVKFLLRKQWSDLSTGVASVVSTVIGVCTNTLLVLSSWAWFYMDHTLTFEGNSKTITGTFIAGIISTNFVAELIICAVITPVICIAVRISLGIDRKGAPLAEHGAPSAEKEESTSLLSAEGGTEAKAFTSQQERSEDALSEDSENGDVSTQKSN